MLCLFVRTKEGLCIPNPPYYAKSAKNGHPQLREVKKRNGGTTAGEKKLVHHFVRSYRHMILIANAVHSDAQTGRYMPCLNNNQIPDARFARILR